MKRLLLSVILVALIQIYAFAHMMAGYYGHADIVSTEIQVIRLEQERLQLEWENVKRHREIAKDLLKNAEERDRVTMELYEKANEHFKKMLELEKAAKKAAEKGKDDNIFIGDELIVPGGRVPVQPPKNVPPK